MTSFETTNPFAALAMLDTTLDARDEARSLQWTFHSQEQQRALVATTHFLDTATTRSALISHGGHMPKDINALVRGFFACTRPRVQDASDGAGQAAASLLRTLDSQGSLLGWEKRLHVHHMLVAPLALLLINNGLVKLDRRSAVTTGDIVRDAFPGAHVSQRGRALVDRVRDLQQQALDKQLRDASEHQGHAAMGMGVTVAKGVKWGDIED